jgi:hypothetical protein
VQVKQELLQPEGDLESNSPLMYSGIFPLRPAFSPHLVTCWVVTPFQFVQVFPVPDCPCVHERGVSFWLVPHLCAGVLLELGGSRVLPVLGHAGKKKPLHHLAPHGICHLSLTTYIPLSVPHFHMRCKEFGNLLIRDCSPAHSSSKKDLPESAVLSFVIFPFYK